MNAQTSNLAQNTVEPSAAPIARMQAFADAGKVRAICGGTICGTLHVNLRK